MSTILYDSKTNNFLFGNTGYFANLTVNQSISSKNRFSRFNSGTDYVFNGSVGYPSSHSIKTDGRGILSYRFSQDRGVGMNSTQATLVRK
ncbi:MAG: hypothetical protein LCH53_06675 [Bacteroidetes bacterium]|nr:hypothetical protein [Bacteroidota bacterium]